MTHVPACLPVQVRGNSEAGSLWPAKQARTTGGPAAAAAPPAPWSSALLDVNIEYRTGCWRSHSNSLQLPVRPPFKLALQVSEGRQAGGAHGMCLPGLPWPGLYPSPTHLPSGMGPPLPLTALLTASYYAHSPPNCPLAWVPPYL